MKNTLNKVAWIYDNGLVNETFRLEAHYPNEINWDNLRVHSDLDWRDGWI